MRIVTSFITYDEKILLLKRSDKVKTMKELWAGVSGVIEGNEDPLYRAKIEIFEEVGISVVTLLNQSQPITISQYVVFPFLFETHTSKINLNWENSNYIWIKPHEINHYTTVPDLDLVLFSLL